jgi:MFS family permease
MGHKSRSAGQRLGNVARVLSPVLAAVLTGFLVIGLALPVLPIQVTQGLGFGAFTVGLVGGSQFAASFLSRVWAGSYADKHGAKRSVVWGLLGASASGVLYLLSTAVQHNPILSVSILLLGRAILGGAESFIITGGVTWGLASVDPNHAGKVIAWMGTAMFAAMAFGGPFGTVIFNAGGFTAIAIATAVLPLTVLAYVVRVPFTATPVKSRTGRFHDVLAAVWLPGIGAALSSLGYGAILVFSPLLFAEHGWRPIWLGFTAFGTALIVTRILLGHLPDRKGGALTALVFVIVEAAGLAIIWLSQNPIVAGVGSALAGLGYSLVYPGFGVEAVRGVTAERRGLVMGIYTVFLDIALGFGSPVLGFVAHRAGVQTVFLLSAFTVSVASAIALRLVRAQSTGLLR